MGKNESSIDLEKDLQKAKEIKKYNELNKTNEVVKCVDRWNPNSKYDVELHGDLKKNFVELGREISEETFATYDNFMRKTSFYEMNMMEGKDLYEFSQGQILDMFSVFASSSVNTLNVYLSIVKSYIDLAKSPELKYITTNVNVANNITYDDLKKLVNLRKKENKIVTSDDFYDLVLKNPKTKIANRQDQAILLLCFEGIKGIDCTELELLKNDDFNYDDCTMKVIRDGKEMIIPISESLAYVISKCQTQHEYFKLNGNSVSERAPNSYKLNEYSEYLIRPRYVDEKQGNNPVKTNGRNIQLKMIRCLKGEEFLNLPYVTPSSLYLSGMIDRLKTYAKEIDTKELTHKEVSEFLDAHLEKLNTYQTYLAYKDENEEE